MKKLLLSILCLVLPGLPANVKTISKTSFEIFDCSVDFAPAVGSDALTLSGVSSINAVSGADSTTAIVAAAPTPAILPLTKKAVFAIQGGVKGQTHLVSVKVVDSVTNEQFEARITVTVD